MRKTIALMAMALMLSAGVKAQFGGYATKKADIEKFKDSRLIVVLFNDSTYNASIKAAVEKYWTFNAGFEFVHDSVMKPYNKPEYSFLTFARSKKSNKIKLKLCSSDDDFNGLIVTNKYRKRSKIEEILAEGFCSNVIDTTDWYPEMVRAVQMLNNYFNYAVQAESDKEVTQGYMMSNYHGDYGLLNGKKLVVELGMLQMKGKEDATALYGNDVEEVDRDEINKAILTQDPELVYMFHSYDEKFCSKLFISAANSELMFFVSGGLEDCKCVAKDLKAFKGKIDKANKD
jgi:hypothetical protein